MGLGILDLVREARSRIREVSVDTLASHGTEGVLLVDVREPSEYAAGHLPGALNVPRGLLEGAADPTFKHRVAPLCESQERPVVLYCQTGGRSALAADTLQRMGFVDVASLAGGFSLWESEGLPVE